MAKDFQGLDHPDVGRGVKLPSVLTRGVMKGGCGVSMGGVKIVRDIIYRSFFIPDRWRTRFAFQKVTWPTQKGHNRRIARCFFHIQLDIVFLLFMISVYGNLLLELEAINSWSLAKLQQAWHGRHGTREHTFTDQLSFLVPLIGGRYHIIPQLAVYTTYIPLVYCLLGDYISPTTY